MYIMKTKHILVSEENYRKLSALGNVTDSFNDVINRLLKEYGEI